jgi:hypothetical protein
MGRLSSSGQISLAGSSGIELLMTTLVVPWKQRKKQEKTMEKMLTFLDQPLTDSELSPNHLQIARHLFIQACSNISSEWNSF